MFVFPMNMFGSSASWLTWDGTLDGSATQFETGTATATADVSGVYIDTNKVLIAYRYNTTVKAVIGTISGTSISFGSATTLFSGATAGFSIATLDTGRVLFVYGDGSTGKMQSMVLSISGTSISTNSTTQVGSSTSTSNPKVKFVNTDECILTYNDLAGTAALKAVILTTSSTTVTVNTIADLVTISSSGVVTAIAVLTTSKVVVFHGADGAGTAKCLVVNITSGTTIGTLGTDTAYSSNNCTSLTAVALDSTHAFLAFRDIGSSTGKNLAISISTNTITVGTETTFEASNINTTGNNSAEPVCMIDASTVLLVYHIVSGVTKAIVSTISGTTVTNKTAVQISASSGSTNASVFIDASHVVALYPDTGSSTRGTAIVLSI